MYSSTENSAGNVPAFLIKLWSLVEDPDTDDLIQWDTGGTGFHVYNQQRFSREILPLYFKHNNIASFIRQLNMYGFRKVTHIDQGGLKIEKDDLQFQHQYFQKGEKDMLQYIKRKVSNPVIRPIPEGAIIPKTEDLSHVLSDVKQMKLKQESTDSNLEYIKRENKLLWQEVAMLRQKHHKQQQIVNKLIQFLVSLVSSSNRSGITIPGMRRMPLAINNVSQVQAAQQAAAASQQVPASPDIAGSFNSLLQDSFSGLTNETSDLAESSNYIIDEGDYTIESPRESEGLLTPTSNSSGPIIHELTDYVVTATPQTETPIQPVFVNSQGQLVAKPVNQQNIILTAAQMTPGAQSVTINKGGTPMNFVLVSPQTNSQVSSLAGNNTVLSPSAYMVHSNPLAATSSPAMSPNVEPAPSLEDALNFGLNVPEASPAPISATNNINRSDNNRNNSNTGHIAQARSRQKIQQQQSKKKSSPALASLLVGKKRLGESSSENDSDISPTKRPVTTLTSSNYGTGNVLKNPGKQINLGKLGSVSMAGLSAPKHTMSQEQAASLDSLVQENSDLNSSLTGGLMKRLQQPIAASAASALPVVSSDNQVDANDANMALAATCKTETDDPLLSTEGLELLTSDLDGLKGILQEQYKVDPNFLMELFEVSNPWNAEAAKEFEELSRNKDGASTSGVSPQNITVLLQYLQQYYRNS